MKNSVQISRNSTNYSGQEKSRKEIETIRENVIKVSSFIKMVLINKEVIRN